MDRLGLGALRRRLDRYAKDDDDLNIYSLQSVAIVMSYFSIGVALELLYTPIAYYLIDNLDAESGVYTVWVILVTLPWSFKVGMGTGGGVGRASFLCVIRMTCAVIGGYKAFLRRGSKMESFLVPNMTSLGRPWATYSANCSYMLRSAIGVRAQSPPNEVVSVQKTRVLSINSSCNATDERVTREHGSNAANNRVIPGTT